LPSRQSGLLGTRHLLHYLRDGFRGSGRYSLLRLSRCR
jgi:hypothetical protein